jgi:hypothetical protein
MTTTLVIRPLVVGLLISIAATSSFGASISIKNAGFENPAVGSGADANNATDWDTPTASTGVLGSPGQFEASPPEGTQVGFLSTNGPRLMSQPLFGGVDPILIAAQQTYSFSMRLGRRNLTSATGNPYELFVAVRPVADDATDLAGATASTSLIVDDSFTPKGSFSLATFTLMTGANPIGLGQQVELVLLKNSGGQALIDAITGDVLAVPECSTIVLFGLILAGVGMAVRRRAA